jgi:histone H3/H4
MSNWANQMAKEVQVAMAAMDIDGIDGIHDDDVESESGDDNMESDLPSDETDTDTEEEDEEVDGCLTDDEEEDDVSEEIGTETEEGDADADAAAAAAATGESSPENEQDELWMQEVRRMQNSTAYLIPRAAMRNLIREVAEDFDAEIDFSVESLSAIQTASEEYLVELFRMSNNAAIHRGNCTVEPCDMMFVRMMAREFRWPPT